MEWIDAANSIVKKILWVVFFLLWVDTVCRLVQGESYAPSPGMWLLVWLGCSYAVLERVGERK